jgi:tungstate transport system substrate-binding protein
MTRRLVVLLLSVLALAAAACGGSGSGASSGSAASSGGSSAAGGGTLVLATTTSVQDSGLLDKLLPIYEQQTGSHVKPIAVGSGAAIEMGANGDADVVVAHDPDAIAKWESDGTAGKASVVMHNDFVILGPKDDPAGVSKATSVEDAMRRIARAKALFVSRGDDSGTNTFELKMWDAAGVKPGGSWYEETGQGMGETIQVAAQKNGYTISDRGTWLATGSSSGMAIDYQNDPKMINVYEVIPSTTKANARVNAAGAKAFAAFLLSPKVQRIIDTFGRAKYGQPLFHPDAGKSLDQVLAEASQG